MVLQGSLQQALNWHFWFVFHSPQRFLSKAKHNPSPLTAFLLWEADYSLEKILGGIVKAEAGHCHQ